MEDALGANRDLVFNISAAGLWEKCQPIIAKYTRDLKQTHRVSLEKMRRELANKPAASSAKDGASVRKEIAYHSRIIHIYNESLKRDIAALEKRRDDDIACLLDGTRTSAPERITFHPSNTSPTAMHIIEEPNIEPGSQGLPSPSHPVDQCSITTEPMEIEEPPAVRVQDAVPLSKPTATRPKVSSTPRPISMPITGFLYSVQLDESIEEYSNTFSISFAEISDSQPKKRETGGAGTVEGVSFNWSLIFSVVALLTFPWNCSRQRIARNLALILKIFTFDFRSRLGKIFWMLSPTITALSMASTPTYLRILQRWPIFHGPI